MKKCEKSFISSKYISMLGSGIVLMVLTAIMGMLDTLIAGIILGEEAVAGICLVLPIYSLASFFAVGFSYGVPILYARKMGEFQKEEADQCFGVGLTVISVIGILMFAGILLGGDAYLRSYQTDIEVYENARAYLGWMKYAVLVLPFNELLDGMLFADGDETISLTANLIQGFLKVVLSILLCRNMGVKGLALASFIGFVASILLSCIHFFRPGNTLKPNLAFSWDQFREILKYGIVDASTHLFISVFTMCINFFLIRQFGSEMLVLAAVISLLKEGQILFEGIGEAITPLISVYLGEENVHGVRKVWQLARWSLWAESLLATVFVLAAAPAIVQYLGILDPLTARYATGGLRILSLTLFFTCRLFLDSSYFILVERVPLGILDSLLRDLLPSLPLAVAGGMIGGIYGMFAGLSAAPLLGYLFSVWYIKKKYGPANYPLFLVEMEQKNKKQMYEFKVLPEEIVKVRDEVGDLLKEYAYSDRTVNMVMLIIEELFMMISDGNPGKTVLAECTLEIGDTVRLIAKDNGKINDLTDPDSSVTSLRSYTLSRLLTVHTSDRVHLAALSYNRNVLEIQ